VFLSVFVEDFDMIDIMKSDELDLVVWEDVLDDKVVGLVDREGGLVGVWLLDIHKGVIVSKLSETILERLISSQVINKQSDSYKK
jgi:hypothetical protein